MSSIETHTPQIGVMLVDDQRVARTGFVLMLRKARGVNVIAEAENGQDTLDVLAQRAREQSLPDVALMDVRTRRMDGIEAIRRIARTHPSVKVLVHSEEKG